MTARIFGVSERTLRHWKRKAWTPARGRGRPGHDAKARREALLRVRRQMRAQGKTAGWRPIATALKGVVPVRLVQWALAQWKRRDRARVRRVRDRLRDTIRPAAPGTMWSLDGMQAGRLDHAPVKAEAVLDVASTRTLAQSVGATQDGASVVAVLDAATATQGSPPLVIASDNGPENANAEVAAWCARNRVVHLRSVPHTPQHDPWIERRFGELRAETGLRSWMTVGSLDEVRERLGAACARLDQVRLRARLGYATAEEADTRARVRYTPAQRETFYVAACAATEAARNACQGTRERARAGREATLRTMESFGLITRTRGVQAASTAPGRPRARPTQLAEPTFEPDLSKNAPFPGSPRSSTPPADVLVGKNERFAQAAPWTGGDPAGLSSRAAEGSAERAALSLAREPCADHAQTPASQHWIGAAREAIRRALRWVAGSQSRRGGACATRMS